MWAWGRGCSFTAVYLWWSQDTGSAPLSPHGLETQPMDTGGETKPGLLLRPALRPAHSRAQDPLFVANVVQTLPSALRVVLPVTIYLSPQLFPLLSFCKRRLGIMTQENTPKATAPSSSFSLNIQRSWKGRLLRFTGQSSGACPAVQARPLSPPRPKHTLSAPVDPALLTPGCNHVPISVIHCPYNLKAPSSRTVV